MHDIVAFMLAMHRGQTMFKYVVLYHRIVYHIYYITLSYILSYYIILIYTITPCRIVLMEQRGCGKSKVAGKMAHEQTVGEMIYESHTMYMIIYSVF